MNVPDIFFKKILYTTDLSEGGRSAFAYGASLCRRYGSELTVFHVLNEGPDMANELVGYMDEKLWEEIKSRDLKEAQQILNSRKRDNAEVSNCVGDYCEAVQNGTPHKTYVTYNTVVELGNPVDRIINFAEQGNYDLIIMGHVGRSTIHDAVLGSTVQRVLRRAKVPVLVIRSES